MRDSRAEAFDAFCNVQYDQLVGAVHLLCGDLGVAQELAQTALERAWSRWDRVSQMASPGGWVQQVAFNLARSRFRRHAAERRAYARHGAPQATDPHDDAAAQSVRQVLMVLPARQREVLVHRFYVGRSTAETAAAMGITQQAAKQLAYRARTRVRELMAEDPTDLEAHRLIAEGERDG